MASVQQRVQALLDASIGRGDERGLQVAAYHRGELVVDAWAGTADRAGRRPVDGQTLFTVFSVSKAVAATAVHLLVARGTLAYDTPVSRYWPEFAAHGKGRVTLGDLLAHRTGVPQLPAGVTPEALCDWDSMCRAIADLEPLWEPGSQTAYSSYTWGWIVGEVVRRADGRPLARVVREEIGAPLGIDHALFFGIPDEAEQRVADMEDGGWMASQAAAPADPLVQQVIAPLLSTPETFNRPDVRRASIPGIGGIMSARALARHFAALIGTVDSVRLLSPKRIQTATALQTDDRDGVVGLPVRKALGYFLGGGGWPVLGPRPTTFGMAGIGGAIGFADPDDGFAFALTKNRMTVAPSGASIAARVVREVRAALGIPAG